MHPLEDWLSSLAAALVIFAVVCIIGNWWLTHEARQDGPSMMVVDGRE